MNDNINSKSYWDDRFSSGDWQNKGGNAQTEYFYTLLYDLLPKSFVSELQSRHDAYSICDVGCAEGDGTNYLSERFTNAKLTGVDISNEAIIKAKQKFNHLEFTTQLENNYNVVVSSNTLEHFDNPFNHLKLLLKHTTEYLVILVPFEEYERIDEHFYTFTYDSFSLNYEDFSLFYTTEVQADPNYWNGKQLLMIFQKNIKDSKQTLFSIGVADLLKAREQSIVEKEVLISDYITKLSQMEQLLKFKNEQINSLEEEKNLLNQKIVSLLDMIDSMRLKNRVKQLAKKIFPFSKIQAIKLFKYFFKKILGETNYNRLKSLYNMKSMDISDSTRLAREIDLEKEKVLYIFPVIDWDFRRQRPQHIALQYQKSGYTIIYFSTVFSLQNKPGYVIKNIRDNIYNVTLGLDVNKNIYKNKLSNENLHFLLQSVAELEKDLFIHKRISIIDHPFWFEIANKLSGAFTIYDCMDYHEGFGDESRHLRSLEETAMMKSDLLVLSSQDLFRRFSKKNKNVLLVRNGCEFKYFNTKPLSVKINEKKTIGYYGAISSWFDSELVIALAKHYSDYDFILIGDTHGCDNFQGLKAMDNIILVGEVPYQKLTEYLYGFDVCIMPFKVNELTQATNPVKIYEYLAAGKPVVSTLLPEVESMGDVVYTATNKAEFISKIDEAISRDSQQKKIERTHFAKSNDWMSRYTYIKNKVNEIKLTLPKVSIVIVTYNNLDFTQKCLESMERFNNYENCEIIIVDNMSSDGTREYLARYSDEHSHVKAILHDVNSGFAAGNNIGIKASTGDIIILLNNDTYVTPNWISNLIRHFDNADVAMVGPRTNNIGNEARIDIKYNSLDEMIQKSYDIYYKNVLKEYEMEVLAFFCVAIKREIIDEVGLLDEAFGIGMFEDDDYCKRVKNAGHRIVCADDVFIHHHLGASFDQDPKWKQKLFEKNRAIFESRYGEWVPHKYRMES